MSHSTCNSLLANVPDTKLVSGTGSCMSPLKTCVRNWVPGLILVSVIGWSSLAQAQHQGGHGALPGRLGAQERGWSPPGLVRGPERDMPEGRRPDGPPRFERVVSLDDAVSMVQTRFKATAVKTETVTDEGQLVYRIRLLSADRSRVWTVSVDARSGQVN